MPGDEDAVTLLGDRMQVTPDEGAGIAGSPGHLNGDKPGKRDQCTDCGDPPQVGARGQLPCSQGWSREVAQTFGWVGPTASRGRGTDAAGALSAWFWSLASRLVRSEESPQSRVVGGVEFELHSPSGDRDR